MSERPDIERMRREFARDIPPANADQEQLLAYVLHLEALDSEGLREAEHRVIEAAREYRHAHRVHSTLHQDLWGPLLDEALDALLATRSDGGS